jgi:hypothetical protein
MSSHVPLTENYSFRACVTQNPLLFFELPTTGCGRQIEIDREMEGTRGEGHRTKLPGA